MAEDQYGERTEQATERRKDEARQNGQVARSAELVSAVALLAGMAGLAGFGPGILVRLSDLVRQLLSNIDHPAASSAEIYSLFQNLSLQMALLLLPLSLCLTAVGVGTNVAQVGFLFTTRPLAPRWSVLNPIQGSKRFFSVRGGVELVKAILKVVIIASVAWGTVVVDVERLLPLAGANGATILERVGAATLRLGFRVGLALLVLAAIDYAYQRWEWERSLRMTRKEIEQEQKEQEGDPRVKARIRMLQRQAARRRMVADVKKADVVITNPVHVAVALQYDRGSMDAPLVLAKGLRKVAERIKEEAKKHGIPIVEDPPLARLLFKKSALGKPIPGGLYRAVAQVLAHVWRLRQGIRSAYRSELGGGN